MRKLLISMAFLTVFVGPALAERESPRPDWEIPNYENLPSNPCLDGNCDVRTSAKKHSNTGQIVVISVAAGLLVAGAAWYFFKKRPSENNPGQISLMTF
ncbi:LPXTG cell wall anchor domain-containing protein [bacterium]|nr:LPXTG cell wall anchor domain-containing protein [bacterium]